MRMAEYCFGDDARMALDVERNGYESIRLIVRLLERGRIEERGGVDVFTTGIPFFLLNGMLGASFPEHQAEPAIHVHVREMKQTGLPFCWMVGPSTTPPTVGAIIESAGLRPNRMPGMWISLDLLHPPPPPQDVVVREIVDARELDGWAHAQARGFGLAIEVAQAFSDAARAAGLGRASVLRPFAAFIDGDVVATSLLVSDGPTAGIYNVCTVEEARRRGIGAAVTHAALEAGRASGLKTGVLFASSMGYPVYKKLGFRTGCTFTTYAWKGAEKATAPG